MRRFKHSLSHYKLLTADMGRLIPVACFEALPGDSIQQATSLLLRMSPLVAPVMHPVTVRVHHWFVPNRLLVGDGEWEDFITGAADVNTGGWFSVAQAGGNPAGSVADYMGITPGVAGIEYSRFPFFAYLKIWNEYYRDQDLQPEKAYGTDWGEWGEPLPIAWEKDYFTSARPWPQKGPDVSLPLGVDAPVIPTGTGIPLFSRNGASTPLGAQADQSVTVSAGSGADPDLAWVDSALKADLTNASAVNVNDVRLAFALQRYQEARARYGSRYTEYLRYLGVRSSDARLQRPEYLGGGKQTISFSEVLKTGGGEAQDTDPIGTMKGHGIAAMRSRRYRRFFEEHGIVLSLLSVRPRTIYEQYLPRMFSRKTKEDYWQKELEQIGQQEIYKREVYQTGTSADNNVFGYQDRYSEYRHIQSSVHAEFRDTLDYWHLARTFAAEPTLNASFVECNPSKRIFAEQTQNSMWLMVNNSIQARRMVSNSPASRIL